MDEALRQAVLNYTSNTAYRPAKPRIIAERLGLEGDQIALTKKTIKKMVQAGELEYGPNHLVLPIDPNHPARKGFTRDAGLPTSEGKRPRADRFVVGTYRRVSSGDGFVRPEGTPAAAGRDDDVYVPAKLAGDAASGDKVRLRLSASSGPRGKPSGKVVDVIERSTNQFVGSYLESAGMALVEIDGGVFGAPVYVGDPGAKGAADGDKVVVEMVRFPSHVRDGEGVITRVLGQRGAPGVDTLAIKYEYSLPGEFAEDALEVARSQAAAFNESIPAGRRDLTADVVITIDPATARDFDDAISLTRLDGGHWELGVHIADVSHFVQPKTALDREAYDRATSVYLPDEVIPMLPEIISNNLASLQPDKVRYAVTAVLEFTAEGVFVGSEVFKSAIKSRRRFTYAEVDAYLVERKLVTPESATARVALAAKVATPDMTPEVDRLLGDMHQLAMTLRRRRFERGALELSMPEIEIDLDKEGRVCGAHVEQNTESHQIIEEFMLSANEAVARQLADAGLLFLRRVHGSPDPRKSRALTEFVRSLNLPAENLQDRFELQELLERVQGDPRQPAVNYAALRSMQKAVYSPEEEGHFALASGCYCHFTSPIRRYPDLTVHRLIEQLNAHRGGTGPKPVQEVGALLQQGDHCSEREQRAAKAERDLVKVKLLNYLSSRIGDSMEGIITGVEKFGLFIMGKDLPAEGFIHITALGDDYFQYDRASHSITGRRAGNAFRLGDTVRVAVGAVDIDARTLDFRYLGRGTSSSRERSAGPPDKKSPRRGGKKPQNSGKPAGKKMTRGKSDKTGKHRRKPG
ncbi:ribonuclease R [Botrimarina hoheduenensis]|uniref:Ribonuclease R n=1 Tax=Botrimarina hoheduenensis TaxID=2528000 RepID=A0A5C5VV20_9BACT|nr:ribonuclease R [Botrimarina hoheduenensis]TWT42486.1 Ribonuclease R [Botrimarina hoheduenensis]